MRFERRLEFAMEGHRFFDLVRWGIAGPYLLTEMLICKRSKTTGVAHLLSGASSSSTGEKRVFPRLPQQEVDLSNTNGKPLN